jgi:hypothetical protein
LRLGVTEEEVAAAYGVTVRTYRRWEAGRPQRGTNLSGIQNFAEKYNVGLDWILSGGGRKPVKCWIPGKRTIIGSVPCPDGVHPDAFALKVVGDCLEPRVSDGCKVIVEPSPLPGPGELAVFWFKGREDKPVVKILRTSLEWGFPHNPKSEIELIVIAEQLNPPEHYRIPAGQIEQVARVHSIVRSESWAPPIRTRRTILSIAGDLTVPARS